jgi:hypothetical protein
VVRWQSHGIDSESERQLRERPVYSYLAIHSVLVEKPRWR